MFSNATIQRSLKQPTFVLFCDFCRCRETLHSTDRAELYQTAAIYRLNATELEVVYTVKLIQPRNIPTRLSINKPAKLQYWSGFPASHEYQHHEECHYQQFMRKRLAPQLQPICARNRPCMQSLPQSNSMRSTAIYNPPGAQKPAASPVLALPGYSSSSCSSFHPLKKWSLR